MHMVRVVLSGATGFIGRQVLGALKKRGDAVTVLTRDPARARALEGEGVRLARWDAMEDAPLDVISACDAVIHLAGEPAVGARWTDSVKQKIRDSRVKSTEAIVRAVERAAERPAVFVCASAVGYYGAHGDEPLDETAAPGEDFLAQVTVEWERAALRAEALGVRVVRARFGIVLGRGGGALTEMVKPFKLFVGGPIASGRQVVSWVHLDDVVGALLRAVDDSSLRGAMNVTAPNAVPNEELSKKIGAVLHRPSVFRVPEVALRLRFGEGADPLVTGVRAVPSALEHAGYVFEYASVDAALEDVLVS
jgi:uncharacterized protein (TIGR01777 family)